MPLRHALGALAALLLAPVALAAPAPPPAGAGAFINEFHYDNEGGDANEFVEVAVFTGVDVSALTLSFYNGSNGTVYEEVSGADFVAGETVGGFTFYTVEVEGIQNGSPDGIALSLGASVQGFLSYEGTLTATDGPANGLTSSDVGVEETGSTLATESLQLTGDSATGFTWSGPAAASPGQINAGQTIDGEGGGDGGEGPDLVSIAEARAAGVGETVRVQGVVTRALGDFLYLQDGTGGLTVRQTSGDLFDDVADGTVGPGTLLEVTGELSEFNDLLQINAGDLDEYDVLGTQAVPDPQLLPADEIADNGEAYEGELVRVEGVTVIDRDTGLPATGNFFDSTSYGLDDGSGDVLTLRIPNADDTTVEGTPIPEGPLSFVGVVGQFGDDYQLLLLSADDVDADGSGGDDPVTIAEARAAGVGETVTIEGVITRAQGDFSYVQDATGALALRQIESEYAQALEAGDIGPGSRVRLTGTLSEFNASLQINEGDLDAFEGLGEGDIPDPQTVTLAEIAANGEDYEDELVRVEDVQIQGTGTFMERTNYGISDGSGAGGLVTLRVPNADDSTVDGEPIPAGPVAVVGILGQFSSEVPDAGYQILAIEAADVNPEGVAAEPDPATGLALEAPNPVRGTATVRFGLGAPGRATLALYDALGRRVATLADGPAGLDETATLDAGDLAAGVYVLRLATDAGALARTLTVVR